MSRSGFQIKGAGFMHSIIKLWYNLRFCANIDLRCYVDEKMKVYQNMSNQKSNSFWNKKETRLYLEH